MSIDSLRKLKGISSFDDDEDLSLEEIGPKSMGLLQGRPLLGSIAQQVSDSDDSLKEMGLKSMAILEGKAVLGPGALQEMDENEDSLKEVGPKSMAILDAGKSTADGPTGHEVNGKESVPVPQPRPRKKPQMEDKHLTDVLAENTKLKGQNTVLAEQLDDERRESEARARQQNELIARLRTQLESKEKELEAATKSSHSKSSKKASEKDAKRKSEIASLQKEVSELKGQLQTKNSQLEESQRLREAEKKQLRKEVDKIRGQLIKHTKTDNGKTRQAEIDGLTTEVDDLKNKLQIKGAQVENLSQLVTTRTEEKERIEMELEKLKGEVTRTDENKTKQAEISRLMAENSDLKRQLRDKNIQIQDLSQSANHQGVEKERLAKETEKLKGELVMLRQSRTDDGKTRQAEIDRLTGEMRNLREQLQAKSTQIEQLDRQVNTHGEEKKRFEREVEKLRGEVRKMDRERSDNSRVKHAEIEHLNTEIGALKGKLQIKNAQVEDLSQLASTRGEEKEQLESEVKQLQEQFLNMQRIRVTLVDDNQAKVGKIEELTTRLNSLSREMERQSREKEQLKQKLAMAQRAGGGHPGLAASDRTCPMCQKQFPESISQQEYERHVQSHF